MLSASPEDIELINEHIHKKELEVASTKAQIQRIDFSNPNFHLSEEAELYPLLSQLYLELGREYLQKGNKLFELNNDDVAHWNPCFDQAVDAFCKSNLYSAFFSGYPGHTTSQPIQSVITKDIFDRYRGQIEKLSTPFFIAMRKYLGIGANESVEDAKACMQRAINNKDAHHAQANFWMGMMCLPKAQHKQDNNDKINTAKTQIQYFKKAAEGNDPYGQYQYGILLASNSSTYAEGMNWVKRAAKNSVIVAHRHYGIETSHANNNISVKFLTFAAKAGDITAARKLAEYYARGEILNNEITKDFSSRPPFPTGEDFKHAIDWLHYAINHAKKMLGDNQVINSRHKKTLEEEIDLAKDLLKKIYGVIMNPKGNQHAYAACLTPSTIQHYYHDFNELNIDSAFSMIIACQRQNSGNKQCEEYYNQAIIAAQNKEKKKLDSQKPSNDISQSTEVGDTSVRQRFFASQTTPVAANPSSKKEAPKKDNLFQKVSQLFKFKSDQTDTNDITNKQQQQNNASNTSDKTKNDKNTTSLAKKKND